MNKRNIFMIGFILLVVMAGAFVFFRNDVSQNQNTALPDRQPENMPKITDEPQNITQPQMAGTYDDFSEQAVSTAPGERVLFFYASWCYQCRQIDEDLKTKTIPSGYSIFKVDFDDRQDLRQKYGITFRTAFIKIDKDGNKIGEEYIAYDEPSLAAVTRDFLK